MTITFLAAQSSQTTANGTTSVAAALPTGFAAGDLLYAVVAVSTPGGADAPVTTIPSGWSAVATSTGGAGAYDAGPGGGIRVNLYQRTATGSEGTTATWGATAVQGRIGVTILAYRNAAPILAAEVLTAGLGGGVGTATVSRPTGTLTLSSSQTNRRLFTVFADVRGTGQSWSAPDTTRATLTTSNVSYVIADTGGGVAAGASYSKTATAALTANTGVQIIFAVQAVANANPVVSAGGNQTVTVGQTVTLSGSASDADGIASLVWASTPPSGGTSPPLTPASNASSTTITSTFTAPATTGVYSFQLTATDGTGLTSTDTALITVQAAASATPTATAAVNLAVAAVVMTGSTGGLTYTCSPSTGVTQPTPGTFLIPRGPSAVTYTVQPSGGAPAVVFTIPAAGTAAPYTGTPLVLNLPAPDDPATDDTWGPAVIQAFTDAYAALNGLTGYYNQISS